MNSVWGPTRFIFYCNVQLLKRTPFPSDLYFLGFHYFRLRLLRHTPLRRLLGETTCNATSVTILASLVLLLPSVALVFFITWIQNVWVYIVLLACAYKTNGYSHRMLCAKPLPLPTAPCRPQPTRHFQKYGRRIFHCALATRSPSSQYSQCG